MVLLSEVVERHQGELERIHGAQLLPSHHQALQAMRRCRSQGDLMMLQCGDCQHRLKVPHSCGHRSCPHCQHHDSQRWIERQQAKLLPVEYFLITFTVPAELRGLIWSRQRQMYDLLLKTAWKTVASFARRDPRLRGVTGAHAVLHTHSRRLEFHPHVHLIVPAGAVHRNRPKKASRAGSQRTWQWKKRGHLFPAANLAKVFRAKWLQAAGNAGLRVNAAIAKDWLVDCKSVGSGLKALVYLGRYLYRGVLPEKDILSDRDGLVTFRIRDNTGAVLIQSVAGAEFLWMLLRHVLPKRFRRARDYGLLHGNSQKLLQAVQLLLHVMLPEPRPAQPRPPIYCSLCGGVMEIVAVRVRVRESSPAPG